MTMLRENRTCLLLFILLPYSLIYSQDGKLKGIVKDDENVLQSATVSINNKNLLTNINGEFLISLAAGYYTITVTFTGYKKLEQDITIEAGETRLVYFNMIREESLDQVVVLGSRSSVYRSNMNTPYRVDAVTIRDLVKNQVELSQMLSAIVPSYNSPPQVLAGGATSLPATLGGLSPDQTLVLLNGRRLHSSSLIYQVLGMGRGTVGTDINSISPTAIEKIEILHNGATAQYGSDAIAGVLDVQLKKTTGKPFINIHTGQHYNGDGETISIDANYGFALKEKGFLNLSAVLDYRNDTWRSEGLYTGTVYYNIPRSATALQRDSIIALDNLKIKETGFDKRKHWRAGLPQMTNAGFLINGGYPLNEHTRSFWTISFSGRETKADANNYRYPKDTLLVITELYPNGFRSVSHQNTWDVATLAGMEGSTRNGWNWNVSATYGGNWWKVNLKNSNNASQYQLGKNAQKDFYCGTTVFQQNTNNINFYRDLTKLIRGVKLFAFSTGAEFRLENYQMKAGEEASYKNYAPTSRRFGGSQVLNGIASESIINKNRYVIGAFVNLEVEQNNKLLYNLSGRYEYYNDFGGNFAGNLALRYKFSDQFTLRGSVSNGFRAPNLPQRYYSEVVQRNSPGISSQPFKQFTFRNDSKIANDFGVPLLTAERSLHISAGITSKLSEHLSLTSDAYRIMVWDRIVLSGVFFRDSNAVVNDILTTGGYNDISSVVFFVNAINTITYGVDLALRGSWKIKSSRLETFLSANFNHTSLYGDIKTAGKLPHDAVNSNQLFNREERGKIERAQPRNKIILLVKCLFPGWGFTLNNIYYGRVARYFASNNPELDEFYSSKTITDISASYTLQKWMTITTGARNVFNIYPDRIRHAANTSEGRNVYDNQVTQFGYSGGYYFVSIAFNW